MGVIHPPRLLPRWPFAAVALGATSLAALTSYGLARAALSERFDGGKLLGLGAGLLAAGALVLWIYADARDLGAALRGDVHCDTRGLLVDGVLMATREELSGGWLEDDEDELRVRLARGARAALRVAVPNEAAGHRVLAALGLDASRAAASFSVPRPALSVPALVAGVLCAAALAAAAAGLLGASWAPELGIAYLGAALAVMAVGHSRARAILTVSAAGLELACGSALEAIPFDQVARVDFWSAFRTGDELAGEQGIDLQLRDGARLRWATDADYSAEPSPETKAILRRIREVLAATVGPEAAEAVLAAGQVGAPASRARPDWVPVSAVDAAS